MSYQPAKDGGNYVAPGASTKKGDPTKFPGTSVAGVDVRWWNSLVVQEPKTQLPVKNGLPGPYAPDAPGVSFPAATPKTLGQMLLQFDNADPSQTDEIGVLQGALWRAGFYGNAKKPTFTPGVKDAATRAAFVRGLKEAVRNKETFGDLLDRSAAARTQAGLGTSTTATHTNVVQHSNPIDVQASALAGFQAALGRGPTAQEQQSFMAAYHQSETAAQPDTAGGGTFDVTNPANVQNAAEAFARKAAPGLAGAHDQAGAFQMMLKVLGVAGT